MLYGGLVVPSVRALRRLLIVDPDPTYRDLLQRLAQPLAKVEAAGDFQSAYSRLIPAPPDLLITKLRLQSKVEGLELAYVLAGAGSPTRSIVYGESAEEWVTRELQRLGAFYEAQSRLQFALPAYRAGKPPGSGPARSDAPGAADEIPRRTARVGRPVDFRVGRRRFGITIANERERL